VLLHTHLTSHGDSTSDKRKAKRRRLEIVTATKSTLEESTSGLKFLFSYFFFNLFNPCSPRTLNSRIGYKWLQHGWLKKLVTKEKNIRKKKKTVRERKYSKEKKYTTKARKHSHV
jgi:hypothetical protein